MSAIDDLMYQAELTTLPRELLIGLVARQEWILTSRPDQIAPNGDWLTWILKAGRGAGKTRTGSEDTWWTSFLGEERVAIVCPTNNDVRKTCYEGESGLLNVVPKALILDYNRTSMEMWIKNIHGTSSYLVGYSAEEPERLRGPQHSLAWCDELAAWRNLQDTWDMLEFTMRLGPHPRKIVTTTPKPNKILRELLKEETTVVTHASTFANAANLPAVFLEKLKAKYAGTRLGRQELEAELLEDIVGALWSLSSFDDHRVHDLPEMQRIVVSLDPSGTDGESDTADDVGIIVAGLGVDGRGYILDDLTCNMSPDGWGRRSVDAYNTWAADLIVAERNFGGAMVKFVVKSVDDNVAYKEVTASRGKVVRAEPVAALYEQGKVSHVGNFPELEDQMSMFTTAGFMGDGSPDRLDAAVWALTELMLDEVDNFAILLKSKHR